MKNILSICTFLLAFGTLPLWGQSQDPLNEDQTTVRILEGDNSDPSIVRYGKSYYLVHSSFVYTPGLVVYKSDDLVNWTPCSTALTTFTGDIWAPDIVVHNNRFYIYFPTLNGKGRKTNMVTWADSPEGPWSTPIDLKIGGIDPEHVVSEDGKRYLLLSSGALYPLSDDGCSITGEPVRIYKEWEIPEEWDIEEVHALLGENGAGKSTLMNILAGVFPADSGEVEFNEKKIRKMTIQQSEKLGIAFVHQELNLFNDLKVYENIFLMKEYKKKPGILDKKRMIRETQQLFTELGVEIEPEEKVENLKTSQKQLLEISKALFFQAKLLILDEPTTSLNNDEVEHLFQIIRRLKEKGTAFIFISHKMPEIFRIADRYTVLRNGEFIKSGKLSEITQEEVTGLMVGEKFSHQEVYQKRELGENVLELNGLSGHGFSNVNLTVKKGSIVGLTGLQGSGSSELLQGLFGAVTVTGGTLKVSGKECRIHSIQGAMKAGIAMLASNRKENSVIPDMSILENMYLSEQVLSARQPLISARRERERYEKYKKLLSIKAADPKDPITSLSGGNQQKVFLARWLNTEAGILLLDNPTQGIDVGAKAEIYKLILKLADAGKTILINTLEIPELAKVADCCAVFYEGTIIKMLQHEEIDEKTVMLYSTNAAQKGES